MAAALWAVGDLYTEIEMPQPWLKIGPSGSPSRRDSGRTGWRPKKDYKMPKRIGNLLPVMTDREFIRRCMVDHAKKRIRDPTTLPALTHIETCIDRV